MTTVSELDPSLGLRHPARQWSVRLAPATRPSRRTLCGRRCKRRRGVDRRQAVPYRRHAGPRRRGRLEDLPFFDAQGAGRQVVAVQKKHLRRDADDERPRAIYRVARDPDTSGIRFDGEEALAPDASPLWFAAPASCICSVDETVVGPLQTNVVPVRSKGRGGRLLGCVPSRKCKSARASGQ